MSVLHAILESRLPAFLVAILLAGPSLPASAAPRVFTDSKGREIIAEIVSAKGDSVRLKKDGQSFDALPSLMNIVYTTTRTLGQAGETRS